MWIHGLWRLVGLGRFTQRERNGEGRRGMRSETNKDVHFIISDRNSCNIWLKVPELAAGNPSPLFVCFTSSLISPVTCASSQQTKAMREAVVYHISNESRLIVCIPETAMIHCLALARNQPLNNVYHCLPQLFNYLANIDITARVPVFNGFKGCCIAIDKYFSKDEEVFFVCLFVFLILHT